MCYRRGFLALIVLGSLIGFNSYIVHKAIPYSIEFLSSPCIAPHTKYFYFTCSKLVFLVNNHLITIDSGFDTDLASIPRILWSFIAPQYSSIIYPSIIHDFLYGCPGDLNRKKVDDIFYAAMLESNVPKFTASKIYFAVRLFGKKHFNKNHHCGDN